MYVCVLGWGVGKMKWADWGRMIGNGIGDVGEALCRVGER